MVDPRVVKQAKLLVEYCTAIKPGDRVIISSALAGLPLAREVYRSVLQAGGFPFVSLNDEEMTEILLEEGNDEQLLDVPEPTKLLGESYDARITILSPTNTRFLSSTRLEQQRLYRKSLQVLRTITMNRTAEGTFRWVGTQHPSLASAQDADMSLSSYADFVYRALHVDQDDPITIWRTRGEKQARLVEWLKGKDKVTVKGANIDLTLSIAGRIFINDAGHFNMPGGEIFTGPVEESVNGWVRFSYPAVYNGNEVQGVELWFEAGRIVKATAQKNEEFLLSVLDTDAGARYLGEWAIGTNYGIDRFTRNILFDEKIGGTLHMAVGAGYPETGSHNDSAVHWDMICDLRDGAEIHIDGEKFYEGGAFLLGEN